MPTMYFSSLAQLWSMDGHGPYVWSAYAIVVTVLVLLVLEPVHRHRRLLGAVRRRASPDNGAS